MSKRKKQKSVDCMTDVELVKYRSQKYKGLSIVEAFNLEYGLNLKENKTDNFYEPQEVKVGNTIMISTKLSNNKPILYSPRIKDEITSVKSLSRFGRFKRGEIKDEFPAKIVQIKDGEIIVDIFSGLFDQQFRTIADNPVLQKNINSKKGFLVEDLRLVRGGYLGRIKVDKAYEQFGEDLWVEAFIPGSQIVLNIERDFEKWAGSSVEAHIVNIVTKPGTNEQSLICSVKSFLEHVGNVNKIELFNKLYSKEEESFDTTYETYEGQITGVINSSKKCGVFVEIPELHITGMIDCKPRELVRFKNRDTILVKITGFDIDTYYNKTFKQVQRKESFVIKNNLIEQCNLKPILKIVNY